MRDAPQFGRKEPGRFYRSRRTAFGVAIRDGKVALIRVVKPTGPELDLPGGAVDRGEDEPAALAREFAEETGLIVRPGARFAEAKQFTIKTKGPVNNCGGFYKVEIVGEDPSLKVEEDHELVFLEPLEALRGLKHDSQAWALAAWLRARGD